MPTSRSAAAGILDYAWSLGSLWLRRPSIAVSVGKQSLMTLHRT